MTDVHLAQHEDVSQLFGLEERVVLGQPDPIEHRPQVGLPRSRRLRTRGQLSIFCHTATPTQAEAVAKTAVAINKTLPLPSVPTAPVALKTAGWG